MLPRLSLGRDTSELLAPCQPLMPFALLSEAQGLLAYHCRLLHSQNGVDIYVDLLQPRAQRINRGLAALLK